MLGELVSLEFLKNVESSLAVLRGFANMNLLTDDECLTLYRQVWKEIIFFNIYFKNFKIYV